jgi:ribosomal protein S16
MSKINLHNYEAYLLDFQEGNLSKEKTAELERFLMEHPELEEELIAFDIPVLTPKAHRFDEKELMKRDLGKADIKPSNATHFMIAASEGILSEADHLAFSDYLSRYPEAEAEYVLYRRLHLKADLRITFPDKQKLKQGKGLVRRLYPALAAAAGLLLLFQLNGFFQQDEYHLSTPASYTAKQPGSAKYFVLHGQQRHPLHFSRAKASLKEEENESIVTLAVTSPTPEKVQLAVEKEKVSDTVSFFAGATPSESVEALTVKQKDTLDTEGSIMPVQIAQQTENEGMGIDDKETVTAHNDDDFLAFGDYVKKRVARVLKGKNTETIDHDASVGEQIGHGISNAVGGKLTIEKDEKGELMAFAIKIGKFEFSKK